MNNFNEVSFLLETLCAADGVSGTEDKAAKVSAEFLSKYMPVNIEPLGTVTGTSDGDGVHIMLEAHLDSIGMVVTAVDDDGFLKISGVGGVDARILAGAEVTVHGKEDLYGVILSTPPHLLPADEAAKFRPISETAVDIGMKKEKAQKLVTPGDRITFNGKYRRLLGNRVSCASLDDRAGVAAILRCLQLLEGKEHNCKITVSFCVQEETGGSGAATSAFTAQPDEAIGVDVSFAKAPDVCGDKYADLGKGPMIGYAPLLDYDMSNTLKTLSESKDIPYQIEVMGRGTGTDCDKIQIAGRGVRTALLSVPQRNMHTAVEVCDLEDIENTAKLMAEYILERGGANA